MLMVGLEVMAADAAVVGPEVLAATAAMAAMGAVPATADREEVVGILELAETVDIQACGAGMACQGQVVLQEIPEVQAMEAMEGLEDRPTAEVSMQLQMLLSKKPDFPVFTASGEMPWEAPVVQGARPVNSARVPEPDVMVKPSCIVGLFPGKAVEAPVASAGLTMMMRQKEDTGQTAGTVVLL